MSKDDAKSNNEEGDSISRPSTAQSTRTKKGTVDKKAEGNNPILTPGGKKPSRPESSRKYKHSRTRQEKELVAVPLWPTRGTSIWRFHYPRVYYSAKHNGKKNHASSAS